MIRLPAILLALALAAFSREAAAHASLVVSEPRDGAVVETVPEHLVLTFNEPVTPLMLRLLSPGGMVLRPEAQVHENRVVVALPPGLPRGTQALSWRVTSDDGHPIAGSVVFSIGAPSEDTGAEDALPAPGLMPAIWLARVLVYLGLLVGVGGVFFAAWFIPSPHGRAETRPSRLPAQARRLDRRADPPTKPGDGNERYSVPRTDGVLPAGARNVVLATLGLGLLAAPLALGLQGLDALGLGLSGLADPHAWRAGWATAYGWTALLALVAMVVAVLVMVFGRATRPLSLVAIAVAGLALAASGHASAAAPQWLTRPAVLVHAVGVAFWIGALVPLAATLSAPTVGVRAATLRRFSAAIPFAVAALALAGIALAAVQLETPSALWTTAYGRILAAKLVLVLMLLALAARNRFRLTRPVERGDAAAARTMRRTVFAEILLAVAILGLVALWRFTPPPRSESAAAALRAAVSVHLHDAETMANVTITPGRTGPVTIEIAAFDPKLQPLQTKEVTVVLSNPAAGVEPIRRAAARTGSGAWTAEATLPVAGEWRVRLDLLVTDFKKVTLEDVARIR